MGSSIGRRGRPARHATRHSCRVARSVGDTGAAVRQHRHRHEKVDVADDRALVQSEPSQDLAEIGVATQRAAHPITQEIVRFAAAAIERVVTTAGIRDDSKQRGAAIGIKHCVDPNIDVALHLDRIGGAVAVAAISGVEAQKIDRLLALQIDEPQFRRP